MDKYVVQRDASGMELLILVAALVVLDVAAAFFGVDSRVLDPRARIDWWPGTP